MEKVQAGLAPAFTPRFCAV